MDYMTKMGVAAFYIDSFLMCLCDARCEYCFADEIFMNNPKLSPFTADNRGNPLLPGDAYMVITCPNGYKYYVNVTADSVLTACAEVFSFVQGKLSC